MNWKKWLVIAGLVALPAEFNGACSTKNVKINQKPTVIIKKEETKKKHKVGSIEYLVDKYNLTNKKLELFDLRGLLNVDLSPKYIRVDVEGTEFALSNEKEAVLKHIKDFYKEQDVYLDFHLVDLIDKKKLNPPTHIGLNFSYDSTFIKRPMWKGFARRPIIAHISAEVCLEYYTHAHFKEGEVTFRILKERIDKVNRQRIASISVHELGHIFGLFHSHTFSDDPIADYLDEKVPNCMSYKWEVDSHKYPLGCGFVGWQKKMIHSYLSKGNVYEGWKLVNYNYPDYYSLVSHSSKYKIIKKK